MSEVRTRIETPTKSCVHVYESAIKAAIQQQNVFWAAEKMGVEADEQDFRTKLTSSELHAVLLLQSILTQYELMIGGTEMWGGKIAKQFPRPDIQRMCSEFSHAELCSHAPFYQIGNKVLGRDTDDFYYSCLEIPELKEHLSYLETKAVSSNPLESTAALTFLEGVVLFSAFAFFKSFNTNGFNLIPHFVAGIDASAKDENFHAMGSAWLYNTCKREREELNIKTHDDDLIHRLAKECYEHELKTIDLIFEKGSLRTITKEQMISFIQDRINVVCGYLNSPAYFKDKPKGDISKWFYKNISSFKYSDFFVSNQVQYVKNIDKNKLVWNP